MSDTVATDNSVSPVKSGAQWPLDQPLSADAIHGARQHAVLTIQRFIAEQQLPQSYSQVFPDLIIPMAAWLIREQRRLGRPLHVGIRGSQGSGKTTLAQALEAILLRCFSVTSCVLSLDDFYRSRREREALSKAMHPLLITRGVPGTHDVDLLAQTLSRLEIADPQDITRLPVFDKNSDDQAPENRQRMVEGRPEIVFLDGWCLGIQPQRPEKLEKPVNTLEEQEDPDGRWRRYVNSQLAGPYADLFSRMDLEVFLKAPSWEAVKRWRLLQEAKLIRQQGSAYKGGLDEEAAFNRFMAHYERLTRRQLAEKNCSAGICLQLDDKQRFHALNLQSLSALTEE